MIIILNLKSFVNFNAKKRNCQKIKILTKQSVKKKISEKKFTTECLTENWKLRGEEKRKRKRKKKKGGILGLQTDSHSLLHFSCFLSSSVSPTFLIATTFYSLSFFLSLKSKTLPYFRAVTFYTWNISTTIPYCFLL